jgi:MOSC domain-containing protein YiiM
MAILRGIAFKRTRRGVVETCDAAHVSLEGGVDGDRIGSTSKRRQVTLLRAEDWADVCNEIGAQLPWTARRANLRVEGLPSFEGQTGRKVQIGACVLEITGETDPCSRMSEVHTGLEAALTPHWRGGATATVLQAGDIKVGDEAKII